MSLPKPTLKSVETPYSTSLENTICLHLERNTAARTTNSCIRFYKYKNIIKDMEVTRPNQVWVTDITYIRTIKGFCYLALITDMHSRKIVGYDLSDSLELNGCVRALK